MTESSHNWEMEYPHVDFIDIIKSSNTYLYQEYGDLLIILSQERSTSKDHKYSLHIFDLDEDLLIWIDKIEVHTKFKLRKSNPIIKLEDSPYMVLVEESEKAIYFITDDMKNRLPVRYNCKQEISSAFLFDNTKVYLTHHNLDILTVLNIVEEGIGEGKKKLSVDIICEHNAKLKYIYLAAHIGSDGLAVFLNDPNFIDIYTITKT